MHKNPKRGDLLFLLPRRWEGQKSHPSFKFRIGSVPNISNSRRGSLGHRCRSVRTTQEKRMNYAHFKYTRGKRRNLPDMWSDILASKERNRGWKRTKKRKQWE